MADAGENQYDKWVERLKSTPRTTQYRVPKVTYTCRLCPKWSTSDLGDAWVHSTAHGPWPEEGSVAYKMMHARPKGGDVDRLPTRYTGGRSRSN
jgi:hypothetical protein